MDYRVLTKQERHSFINWFSANVNRVKDKDWWIAELHRVYLDKTPGELHAFYTMFKHELEETL